MKLGRTVVSRRQPCDPRRPRWLREEKARQDALRNRLRDMPDPSFDRTAHAELDLEWRASRREAADIRDLEEALAPLRLSTIREYMRGALRTIANGGAPSRVAALLVADVCDLSDVEVDEESAIAALMGVIGRAERRGYERGRADEVAARMADDDAP